MCKNGALRFEEFGYSMPVSESLFGRPPFKHHGVDVISATFETDYEYVSKIVPEQLAFTDSVPRATLVIESFKNAAIPNYLEAMIMLHCTYRGEEFMYMPSLLVTAPGAMVTGREVWGYPKKPAAISLEIKNGSYRSTLKRPTGAEILSVTAERGERLSASAWKNTDGMVLKQIPSAEHKAPDVCQLVGCPYYFTPAQTEDGKPDIWKADNVKIKFDGEKDPWRAIPVENVVEAVVGAFDTSLSYGYVVYDYMK